MCAMRVFNVGDVLAAADVTEYLENTRFAIKPSGTTRSSAPGLVNDPDLSLTVDANKYYWLDAFIIFTSPVAAQFKWLFTIPAGTVFTGYGLFSQTVAGYTGVSYSSAGVAINSAEVSQSTASGTDDFVSVRGIVNTAGTGGALTLQWAQNASNAGNTIVRAGSSMTLHRVA